MKQLTLATTLSSRLRLLTVIIAIAAAVAIVQ